MYLLTREDFKGLGNGIGKIKLLLEKFRKIKDFIDHKKV